jgi:hypothetical protein
VLFVPLPHGLRNGVAHFQLSFIIPLLALPQHIPHGKCVLHVAAKRTNLGFKRGIIMYLVYDGHDRLRDYWSNVWFTLHRHEALMLREKPTSTLEMPTCRLQNSPVTLET